MNMNSFLPALQESLRTANNPNSFVDRSSDIPDSVWNFSEINSAVATPTIVKTTALPHEDLIANLITLAQKRVDEEKFLHLNIKAASDLGLDLDEHDVVNINGRKTVSTSLCARGKLILNVKVFSQRSEMPIYSKKMTSSLPFPDGFYFLGSRR